MSTSHFRFLDLPKEVRLRVYEIIPHRTVRHEFVNTKKGMVVSSFALITSSVQMAVLATCRTINEEAKPIIQKKIDNLLDEHTKRDLYTPPPGVLYPRIEADCEALEVMSSGYGLFHAITNYFALLRSGRARSDCEEGLNYFRLHGPPSLQRYQPKDGFSWEGLEQMVTFIRQAALRLLQQDRQNTVSPRENCCGHKIKGQKTQVALIERPHDNTFLGKRKVRNSAAMLGTRLRMETITVAVTMCNHDSWTREDGLGRFWHAWYDGFWNWSREDVRRWCKAVNYSMTLEYPGASVGAYNNGFSIADRDKYWRTCEWV